MKRAKSSIRAAQLLPCIDLGLLLVLFTCGTGALIWAIDPPDSARSGNGVPSATASDLHDQIKALQSRIAELRSELDRKQAEAKQLQVALDKTGPLRSSPAREEHTQIGRELERRRQEIEELNNKLRALEQDAARLEQDEARLEKLRESISEITARMAQMNEELERLNSDMQDLQNDISQLEKLPFDRRTVPVDWDPVYVRDSRQPVPFILVEDTVTPVREPYYTARQLAGGWQVALKQKGETAEAALAAGSEFWRIVGEIDRSRQYVFLYVDSSSFESFRRLRASLRQRGIPYGWDPTHSTTFSSGGRGGVESGTVR